MNILVTGGSGFLGGHVLDTLSNRGHSVYAFHSSDFDLRKRGDIKRLLRTVSPSVIIHLAAKAGGIGANRENPAEFFYDNAIMGIELMEQARLHGVKKFVQIGTICSYPKHTPIPFKEEDIWNGYPEETNAAYGLAKKMLLVQGQAYRQQYGFNIIHLMPTNLYGPRDNFNLQTSHVIPALIKKMLSGDSQISVWGTGTVSRDFLYVRDAAMGIVLATEEYNSPEPVNLGSGREITIAELVNLIRYHTNYTGEIVWEYSKPDGQPRRMLDTTRAEQFGFYPTTNLGDGIAETIKWFKQQ